MSDHGSSESDHDSEKSSLIVYTAEEDDLYRVKRSLLVHSAKDLFDTLCLVKCRSHIPKRMVERFPGDVEMLRRTSLVYMSGSPPNETYIMTRSARHWNWVQLQSNHTDLQAAFGHACAYYQDEFINHRISREQQLDLVDHVEELALLYSDEDYNEGLVANPWFAILLRMCARICLEIADGGEGRAQDLEQYADLAELRGRDVQTL